jgi:hypothetical protein
MVKSRKKAGILVVCFLGLAFVAVLVAVAIAHRMEQASDAKRLGKILTEAEDPTNIEALENRLQEHGFELVEFSAIRTETSEVIARRSSGRTRLKGWFPQLTEIEDWSISEYDYVGSEGEFLVFVGEAVIGLDESRIRLKIIVAQE